MVEFCDVDGESSSSLTTVLVFVGFIELQYAVVDKSFAPLSGDVDT